MSRHKLYPAPPPRCIHVYAQGWACPRPVESNGLCRVHGPRASTGLSLVRDLEVVEEAEAEEQTQPAPAEAAPVDLAADERAAIALLALHVEQSEAPIYEGIPLQHAVVLARQFLKRTRRGA